MKTTVIVLLLVVMSVASIAQELKPFESDGCSIFPDGTLSQNKLWLNCCIAHDKAYWIGGTDKERLQADQELNACVAGIGEPEIAKVMLAGVRVGGSPYLPTPFRWGYGWRDSRGYKPLDDTEKALIAAEEARAVQASTHAIERIDDIEMLHNTRNAMCDILEYVQIRPDIFPPERLHEKRLISREQRLIIWQTWQDFLDRILVLDALQQRYGVHKEDTQAPFDSIGYAAFLAQYRYAMDFIEQMENDPTMHTVLNEAVPELGLKKGRYSVLKFRFLNVIKGVGIDGRCHNIPYETKSVLSLRPALGMLSTLIFSRTLSTYSAIR